MVVLDNIVESLVEVSASNINTVQENRAPITRVLDADIRLKRRKPGPDISAQVLLLGSSHELFVLQQVIGERAHGDSPAAGLVQPGRFRIDSTGSKGLRIHGPTFEDGQRCTWRQ